MRVPFARLTLRRVLILLIVGGASIAVPMAVGWIRGRVREGELQDSCGACLRQVGSAVVGYRSNHAGVYPPGTVPNSGLPPERRLSWVTLLYGYFDESQNVHFLFDTTAPWDSKRNRVPVIRSDNLDDANTFTDYAMKVLLPYRVLTCPANTHGRTSGVLQYVGIAGLGLDSPALRKEHPRAGIFGHDREMAVGDIKDGVATTMMLAETTAGLGPWIAGGPTTVRGLDPARKPYIGNGRQFGGNHRAGLNVAFADGSVRFLSETIDSRVFEALSTVAGGEPLPSGSIR